MSMFDRGVALGRTLLSARVVFVMVGCLVLCLWGAAARAFAAPVPVWSVQAGAPTYFVPSTSTVPYKGGVLKASVTNTGDGPANGVTITDRLPAGLSVVDMSKLPAEVRRQRHMAPVELRWCGLGVPGKLCGSEGEGVDLAAIAGVCTTRPAGSGQEVVCTVTEATLKSLQEKYGGSGLIQPGQYLGLAVNTTTSSSAPEGPIVNGMAATGGGAAATVEGSSESTISSHPSFGIAKWSFQTTEAVPAEPDREHWAFVNRPVAFSQAGGHPDALTATLEWATEDYLTQTGTFAPTPVRNPKDVYVTLPQGLLGNPTAVPRCPISQALSGEKPCSGATQVGVFTSYFFNGQAETAPIYNITPEAGQSAEFLLSSHSGANFTLTAHVVRVMNPVTGRKEYSLQVDNNGTPNVGLYKIETTFWGDPASETHRAERGLQCSRIRAYDSWECGRQGNFLGKGNEPSSGTEISFLTWQSDCSSGSERALVESDSWEDPVLFQGNRIASGSYATASAVVAPATGCGLLPFSPGISLEPDTLQADAPVGLGLNLTVPQFEEPEQFAAPELRKTVISLPPGMSISPGIVDGIQACQEFGREGINIDIPPSGVNETEEVGLNGALQLAPGHCPNASTVGTAEAFTPLLDVPIKGHVYLAIPGCGNAGMGQAPCTEKDALDGNLYRLYLELGGTGPLADTGVNIKVRLDTEADPATGQLTSVASEIAQLPFSELKIHLNGGPRAPLDNPATCGPAVTSADFSTWAGTGTTPEGAFVHGIPDANPSSFYNVDLAGDGQATPCPGLPLNPGFVAGTVTPNAGKFSAFTMNIGRIDREQFIKGIQVHTPPGLLAMISSVPLCGEPQADQGTCPESSQIGTTRVASGAGSHPFEIEGKVYLTGPHDGAPFGLSVVTHAVAGPFDLGLVIVRARIDIDPNDSTATITTDETGPYALPQIIFGVPLRLQRVTVNIDRPGFMFNPTDCDQEQIGARISGNQQAVANVASPFAVGNCTSLKFSPSFKASTNGHTSRHAGASLYVKLSYPKGAMGKYANIKKVKVSLPKALPSYLPTLQKACLAETFETNPAECPPGSIVGIARTSTPLLAGKLEGPVYFVSHGGQEFPSLIVVLQGDGVRVDVLGSTFIKHGITSSTFKTVPDVPVNTFELYLPQGPNHALAANGSLCKNASKLRMPTEFVAQNGRVRKQTTKIAVTGCRKAKTKRSKHHRSKKAHSSRTTPHPNASVTGRSGR